MTDKSNIDFAVADLSEIRHEQARLLNRKTPVSCRIVEVIIIVLFIIIWGSGSISHAAIWFSSATFMVLVTYAFAKRTRYKDITIDNYKGYLFGHTLISGATGLTWGLFACYHTDWSNPFSVLIAGSIPMIITVGGMMPSSSYRREYIVLASCALLPFAFYTMFSAPGSLKALGVATLTYFGLCLGASAQSEINTRDGILARRTQAMTKQLRAQNEEIQRASEEKTRFLAATSHDLAQPLHAQGYFIHALKKNLISDTQVDLLGKIEASWRAQGKLLEGLVDITRLDSGAIRPKVRTIFLEQEMQLIADEHRDGANKKSVTLSTNFQQATVQTDPVLLARVVRNVLSNAIKFCPEGAHIHYSVKVADDLANISICDNGPGIHAADHEKIFEEYIQLTNVARNRSEENGLGLGLSIVKRLTDLLDIDMHFTSAPNNGTEFTFCLPVYAGQDITTQETRLPEHDFKSAPLFVLIDDEIAILEGMATLLTNWGAQVISASTGEIALALLSETQELPALLIVDKRLKGGENGINIIERLREEVNQNTPAILMSGDLDGFDELSSETDIHLMTKPVAPRDLKAQINNLLIS